MREKLIDLAHDYFGSVPWYADIADLNPEELIDHLIANGVTIPVRCKDCKHWLPEDLERCKAMKSEPYGWCNRYPQRTDWQDTTYEDDFCSYGERRTDD